MEKEYTQRGFGFYKFKDRNGGICNIQKSSLATENAIWFGADELNIQHFKAGEGWKKLEFPNTIEEHVVGNERMHLTQKQVKELLPILQKFADTGEL